MSFPGIHRVVTGHDADGKSIVAINGPLPTIVELNAIPGMIFHEVWETRGTPAQVDNGADPTTGALMHQPPKARHPHPLRRHAARRRIPCRWHIADEGAV